MTHHRRPHPLVLVPRYRLWVPEDLDDRPPGTVVHPGNCDSWMVGSGVSNAVRAAKGSIDLAGLNDFVLVPNAADLAPRTGDFTVEWWQWVDSVQVYMRYFSIGAYSTGCTLAAATQAGTAYFWIQSGASGVGAAMGSHGTMTDGWHHFALVRSSGTVKFYKDGANLSGAGVADSNDATHDAAKYFAIGDETTDGVNSTIPGSTAMDGRIAAFHYVVGTALYTADFIVQRTPPVAVANTKVLLLSRRRGTAYVDSSPVGRTGIVPIGDVTWSSASPF